jgi:hypothetical protein
MQCGAGANGRRSLTSGMDVRETRNACHPVARATDPLGQRGPARSPACRDPALRHGAGRGRSGEPPAGRAGRSSRAPGAGRSPRAPTAGRSPRAGGSATGEDPAPLRPPGSRPPPAHEAPPSPVSPPTVAHHRRRPFAAAPGARAPAYRGSPGPRVRARITAIRPGLPPAFARCPRAGARSTRRASGR